MALAPGTRLGPYEVTAQIGAGGMGEVYRALDTKLNRNVALKILPAEFATDPERRARFKREAQVLATLNHPHIGHIYGFEESSETYALVLELVEGPTLSDRIARGPLLVDEAVAIAKQIAEALEAAHEQDIVHRDLKPANIKIREDGTVKVLDFGLAKAPEPAPASSPNMSQSPTTTTPAMTRAGMILGTVAYMSPEQASGKIVDARSDIFSFGAVLYEMLSGRRAFNGDGSIAIIASVLRDEPSPLLSNPELAQIVTRCLSKSPVDRFQTMTSVKASLAAVTLVDRAPAIAVLPFANMSDDKSQEYFGDGLAEEILNTLVQIPGLRVTARTSAFAFRGKEQDITKIAEALRVTTILDGSVRKSGNRLRVTAQLINAIDGYHIWSQRYDLEMADIFVMQDEIAADIASALRLKLGGTPVHRRKHQPNLRAYEAFLKARHLMQAEPSARVKDAFEQAIELDPQYAEAHAELASWYWVQAALGLRPPREATAAARAHALKAVELTPAEPRALAVLGAIAALYEHDWKRAGERFQLALAAQHVPPEVQLRYAILYLVPLGRFSEALDQLERAVEQDPLNVLARGTFALFLNAQSPDRAVAEAQKAIEIDDRHWLPYYALSMYHFRLGELSKASELAERSAAAARWMPLSAGLQAGLLRRLSRVDDADAVLMELKSSPSGMVIYHLVCGDVDAAADSFANAIAHGEVQPHMWAGAADFLKPLRSSSRWSTLVKLLNLPPDAVGN